MAFLYVNYLSPSLKKYCVFKFLVKKLPPFINENFVLNLIFQSIDKFTDLINFTL